MYIVFIDISVSRHPLEYTMVSKLEISLIYVYVVGSTYSDMKIFLSFQVERLARESFFFLIKSFPFEETSFGELSDTITINKPMLQSRAVSYVFDLHPPADIQFGDYAAALHKCLHDNTA